MSRHPVRLGRIPWINTFPVYGAIDRGLVKVDAEMVSGTASELNDLLAAGGPGRGPADSPVAARVA